MKQQLTYYTNMVGNFKLICLMLITFLSCSNNRNEDIANELINQNFNCFLTDLPSSFSKESSSRMLPIIVNDSIMKNDFIVNFCQDNCFEKINKEGFKISSKTIFDNMVIKGVPQKNNYAKILLVKDYKNLKYINYITLNFYNFYFDKELNKAFIIVEKVETKSKWGKTEVYFFKIEKGEWKFYKKELLLIG